MKPKFSITYPDGSKTKALPERASAIQEAIVSTPRHQAETRPIKVTTLPIYGIRIEDDGTKVTVTSCLQATNPHNQDDAKDYYAAWETAMITLEDMIKYHYMSGVKITSKRYVKGLENYMDWRKVHA